MSYLHIDNLYKNQEILMFKECYAMEKIHGTSAHISFIRTVVPQFGAHVINGELQPSTSPTKYKYHIRFSSGGEKHSRFIALFDEEFLLKKFQELNISSMVIYGEAYGGKQQGMSATYGKELKFITFEVKIDNIWLNVPKAEEIVKEFSLEFVYYRKVLTILDILNTQRDNDSFQAYRNGMGWGKKREGIILRPLIELKKNNGERIISKYKREDFRETKTKREVSPDKLKIMKEAEAIAEEWVTEMRLSHVLDKFPKADITQTGDIIKAMIEDIKRESKKEVIWSKEVSRAIAKKSGIMFKSRITKIN